MDVRCDHCQTEYEFDDSKITEAGVTVKCTVCNHVFKVKKKAMVVTEPVKLSELDAGRTAAAAGAADKPREREWKVRQGNGNIFSFKELTTLQKWIVERKVSRDDEISLTGEAWKRLGNIAELASFFQVVEAADRAAAMASAPSPQPQPLYQAPAPAPMQQQAAPAYPYGGYPVAPTTPVPPMQQQPMGAAPMQMIAPSVPAMTPAPMVAVPPPQAAAPAPQPRPMQMPLQTPVAAVSSDPDEAELAAVRRGGSAKYFVGALVVGALIGAGAYFKATTGSFNPFAKAPAPEARPAEPVPPPTPAEPAPPKPAEVAEVAVADPARPADPAAAMPAADPSKPAEPDKPADPAEEPEDKAAARPEEKPAGPRPAGKPEGVAVAAAGTGAAPAGRSFDWYIQQAYRLRERNQATAALGYYEKAAEMQPDSVEPMAGKAYCLVDLGRLEEAISLFQKALSQHPRYLDAIMGLAEAYKEKGDNRRAVEYYKRYVDQAPDGPEAQIARNNIERLKE